MSEVFDADRFIASLERQMHSFDNQPEQIQYRSNRDATQLMVGNFTTFQDRLHEIEEGLKVDKLTGLQSSRYAEGLALSQEEKGKSIPAVIVIGLNGLKILNAEKGPKHGDAALKVVASRVANEIAADKVDIICRENGNRILVAPKPGVVPEIMAQALSDQLNMPFIGMSQDNGLILMNGSVSIGMAVQPAGGGMKYEALRKQAELNLQKTSDCARQSKGVRNLTFFASKLG